jgi:hypothetical protein
VARNERCKTLGKLATKCLPPLGTRQVGNDVVFPNFGYEEDPPMALPLEPSDEPNRYCIQLYHVTAPQVDLTGKKVLEVSCGAGGGASYMMRTLSPACYTGLDLNPVSIDLARKSHNVPGLDFVLSRRVPQFAVREIRYGVGVMDRDLERDGGIAYRLYCFVKD